MADDEIEFEGWYRAVYPTVAASLSVALADPDIGRDAADEAVVRAYERWPQIREMQSPVGWLYRVGLNVGRRRLRRRALEDRLLRRHRVEAVVSSDDFWLMVGGLAPRQRQAVALRYVARLHNNSHSTRTPSTASGPATAPFWSRCCAGSTGPPSTSPCGYLLCRGLTETTPASTDRTGS